VEPNSREPKSSVPNAEPKYKKLRRTVKTTEIPSVVFIYRFMIKGWKTFYESNNVVKTEIIQEVIYFGLFYYDGSLTTNMAHIPAARMKRDLSESWSRLTKIFDENDLEINDYYDVSTDGINKIISDLEEISRKDGKTYERIVDIYNTIRKQDDFARLPQVHQIEDAILSFIENENFYFHLHIYYSGTKPFYLLSLNSKPGSDHTPEQLIETFNKIQRTVKKLKFPTCPNPFLQKIQLYNYEREDLKNSIRIEILIK